jgi:uncharacterized protein YecE (DUF72 family)
MDDLRIGTCSWNYDSWVGLVYSTKSPNAAGYLKEYSQRYRTAEVDSWFYKLPERREVLEYLSMVDEDFRFTCKVPESISLTHKRNRGGASELLINRDFLSKELFLDYLGRIEPMLPQVSAVMLEFEYLNQAKMGSVDVFMKHLDDFRSSIPAFIPLAIEVRNKNFLTKEYFQFLRDKALVHVFSEKIYMPHIYEVYEKFGDLLTDTTVIRLLGGDRKEIEQKTKERWDAIVELKEDKGKIVEMTKKILYGGGKVIISVNNHYEGSAPLTIEYFMNELQ